MSNKKIYVIITFFLAYSFINAFERPYIPSYDDWYEGDLAQALLNKNRFKEPSDEVNYGNYRYIGAHATEKYPRFFPEYALQEQPVPSLLSIGVRGLMLTVYNWSLNWSSIVREGRSIVCSYPGLETKVFTKDGRKLYQTLHYEMNRIFNFLKSNPKAIITIVFDDQCDISKLMTDIKEIIFKNNYNPILRPSDWVLAQKKGEWPTLGWMRKNNKRLLLFTKVQRDHTEFTWPLESYFWENNYGSTDVNIVCSEQREIVAKTELKNRTLVNFGCFGSPSAITQARNYRKCFDYDFIKKLTIDCQNRRFAQKRVFNGYWTDHIVKAVNDADVAKKKTAFDYVNELNDIKK